MARPGRARCSLALLALALALAGCGEDGTAMSRTDDPRLATPDHAVVSPSGDYRLEVVEGEYEGEEGTGTWWRIRIRDRQGEVVLDSPKRFSARFTTLVLWRDGVDRAWVHSSDVGAFFWERSRGGRWSGDGLGPEGIVSGRPPVPRWLVERFPEQYGPQGRERARRILREQGPSTGPLDSGVNDDDPRLKKPE